MLAAVGVAAAALLWPSVLSLPYELLLLVLIWHWARAARSSRASKEACRALQAYTGLVLLLPGTVGFITTPGNQALCRISR